MKKTVTIVDPPGGWQHGFPAVLQDDYVKQLLDAGYTTKEVPFLLKHSRYWEQEVGDD